MITRLKVDGFKNLVGVDVRFGPFTCIAGANGVGKSNLFDAIVFLSRLADSTLLDAASHVRDPEGRSSDIRSLFSRGADGHVEQIRLEAEMVVPKRGTDDLGQPAEASITFLRYQLTLRYLAGDSITQPDRLVIDHEALVHVNVSDAAKALGFEHKPAWRKTAVHGRRTSPFLSTVLDTDGTTIVQRHQDGNAGRTQRFVASGLPRTLLSSSNALESPTALVARREMQSWHLLHFEPTALRRPDDFRALSRMGADGAHLPATLYRLAHGDASGPEAVYARVANRLSELLEAVREIWVERDEKRELLTVRVEDDSRTAHAARSLSDGTRRFLALAVLQEDPDTGGVWCLEEPENGLYPARIPSMLNLLQDIAVDPTLPVGPDNPLRQVIINTHSPSVVKQVPPDALVAAVASRRVHEDRVLTAVEFKAMQSSWRTKTEPATGTMNLGWLLDYLSDAPPPTGDGDAGRKPRPRVVDLPEVKQLALDLL